MGPTCRSCARFTAIRVQKDKPFLWYLLGLNMEVLMCRFKALSTQHALMGAHGSCAHGRRPSGSSSLKAAASLGSTDSLRQPAFSFSSSASSSSTKFCSRGRSLYLHCTTQPSCLQDRSK